MKRNEQAVRKTEEKTRGNGKKYAQGFNRENAEDRGRFIESHMPLVISLVKKRANCGVEFEDLVQEGILGLITAADKFDPGRGFRFSTYATWWIRQAIDDAILKQGDTIKKPSNYASHLKHLLKVRRDLEKELGRKPATEETAEKAGMDFMMVRQLLSLIPGTVSLDTPISDMDDSSNNYMDVLEDRDSESPDESSIAVHLREDLCEAMKALTDKERQIIDLRFGIESGGEGRSLREVGRMFQLSPERIRQIEEAAIRKLRMAAKSEPLREYLN